MLQLLEKFSLLKWKNKRKFLFLSTFILLSNYLVSIKLYLHKNLFSVQRFPAMRKVPFFIKIINDILPIRSFRHFKYSWLQRLSNNSQNFRNKSINRDHTNAKLNNFGPICIRRFSYWSQVIRI